MASRIPDEKKIKAVQEVEAGTKTVKQIYAEFGIQSAQFKGWKAKFGSPVPATGEDQGAPVVLPWQINELFEEMKELRAENQQLRKMCMDLLLEQRRGGGFPKKKLTWPPAGDKDSAGTAAKMVTALPVAAVAVPAVAGATATPALRPVFPVIIASQPDRVPEPSAPHIPYPPVRRNKEAIRPEPGRRYRRFPRPAALPDLKAFKKGSTRAIFDFYAYLKPRILYHLKDLFPDITEMTSSFDDIFLAIWERRMTFETMKELIGYAYLSTTLLHGKFNAGGKRKPENAYSLEDLLGGKGEPADELYRDAAEESEYFRYLIQCLPYPYKDVLLMHLEEWTPEERKTRVDVVPAIERTYYQYGIRLLRKYFGVRKLPQQVQSRFENWRRHF